MPDLDEVLLIQRIQAAYKEVYLVLERERSKAVGGGDGSRVRDWSVAITELEKCLDVSVGAARGKRWL